MVARNYYTTTETNEKILQQWCHDWELGKNVGKEKGGRKPQTILNNYKRVKALCYFAEREYGITDITKINAEQIHHLFKKMQDGVIKKPDGKPYTTIANYIARFKCFWNWYARKNRRENNKTIPNIVEDLINKKDRPSFTEFNKDELEKLGRIAEFKYKVLMWFYFDSGVRPQEGKFIKVGDVQVDKNDVVWLTVRDEIAKKGSFGRRFKLHLCGELLKQWIADKPKDELLFPMRNTAVNMYIKRLCEKAKLNKSIHLYDFRHASAMYFINIIRKDQLIKYRFGWKNSDKVEYYTRYKGLVDDTTADDLLESETRTRLEKELLVLRKQMELQKDQIQQMEKQATKTDLFIKLLEKKGLIKT